MSTPVPSLSVRKRPVGDPETERSRTLRGRGRESQLIRLLAPRTVVPVHYEGWTHFREGRAEIERELAGAAGEAVHVRWAPIGEPIDLVA